MRLSGIEITKNDSSYTIQCLLDDEVLYFKTSHIFLYEEQVSLFDAFVIAVIPVMIERQEMLYVDGAVDSFLFRQLNEQILPRLSKINDLQDVLQIQSLSDVIHQFDNQNRVTGVSCGVDSMATIKNLEEKKTQLDYLAFFDAGSHGSYGTKNSSINYEFRKKNALEFAKKLSYELIEVRTNAHKFLTGRFKSAHSFLNLSCAFATQGLINHYYYASAYAIGQSTQQSGDTSNYDHIILPFLESSYFKTSSTLGEINRLERIEFISDYALVQNHLDVCTNSVRAKSIGYQNCTDCEKCMRTAISLEVLGVLKNYNGVFDLDRYHKNVDDYTSSLLLKENTMHDAELLTLLKANNRITRNHYLIALKKKLKKSLKKFLKVFRK